MPLSDDLQIIERIARIGEKRADRLPRVQDAPAAKTDDQVAPGLARTLDPRPHQLDCRLPGDTESFGGDPVRPQPLHERRRPPGVLTRDHQGPPAQRLRGRRRLGHHARPEQDAGRGGELETHGLSPPARTSAIRRHGAR